MWALGLKLLLEHILLNEVLDVAFDPQSLTALSLTRRAQCDQALGVVCAHLNRVTNKPNEIIG
jgi:hypothetical protein